MTQRQLEHTTDVEAELPAMPDEQQQTVIQLQKVYRMTIEPGLMYVPVSRVTGGDNSEKIVVIAEHPIEGDKRFYFDKPKSGWSEDHEMMKLFRWYDITDANPFELQTEYVYIEDKGDESDNTHDWEMVAPPNYSEPEEPEPPVREQLREHWENRDQYKLNRTVTTAYTLLMGGAVTGALLAPYMPLGVTPLTNVVMVAVFFLIGTVVAVGVTDP